MKEELYFLPLGGAGEIGMNFYLYGFGPPDDPRWLIVDLGITFTNGAIPGVDVILPDPAFIEERRDNLLGIVLTHAHEDHLGAVAYLWDRLQCPLFAAPFTASLLRGKLRDEGIESRAKVSEIPVGGSFDIGPFALEFIPVSHSIPEAHALVVKTAIGTVLHTGDWTLDPDPVIGEPTDRSAFRRLGDEGIAALVCDSTNVFVEGRTGSEGDLLPSLTELIAKHQGRIAVACFASNVARLKTIAAAAAANGRAVVLAGRSLRKMDELSRDCGYLEGVLPFLDEKKAESLPKEKTLIVCTGSQGEVRAALSRIAAGNHPNISLEKGDVVVFSSRVIPGNETAVGRIQNQLIRCGVEIVTWKDHFVHVSGHPARDELMHLYEDLRPQICIPIHGETRHLAEQEKLAKACGVPETLMIENGEMARLIPGPPEVVDETPFGRLALEGGRAVPLDSDLLRGRAQAAYNGVAMVTISADAKGKLVADPQLTTIGLLEEQDREAEDEALSAAFRAVSELPAVDRKDDDKLREAVRIAVRRVFRKAFGKKPVTHVHLVRI
jgi:ribonuclease J